eukprot:TRINITY_DN22827_c0_g2_i2.p1 TRINITY_DN22827_c0_g2~~TRINITY_DN22827_c0_g2_i2.p1  ORF type:complete len:649 (-),score=108.01 TRINITY_DN22827_c0_g2_i2:285-2231(-)
MEAEVPDRFDALLAELSSEHQKVLRDVKLKYQRRLEALGRDVGALASTGRGPQDLLRQLTAPLPAITSEEDAGTKHAGAEAKKVEENENGGSAGERMEPRASIMSFEASAVAECKWRRTSSRQSTRVDLVLKPQWRCTRGTLRATQVHGVDSFSNTKRTNRMGNYGKFGSRRVSWTSLEMPNDWTINPHGSFRLSWDVCGAILIAYDVLFIPFQTAFKPGELFFFQFMDWLALIFWSIDMIQGFFMGYYQNDTYIKSHWRIFKHYMKTWFLLDFLVVVPEWLSKALEGNGSSLGGFGRFFKSARAVRVLRLLRLVKLKKVINCLYDRLESEYTFICVNLVKLMLSVALLTHVIACGWFWTGIFARDSYEMPNWIDVSLIEKRSLWFKYTTALHWSLTQFTPASMDVSARNELERVYSIVVLFFAMVTFSSIIGSITSAMSSIRGMKGEENKQLWLIRRFLRQNHISSDLGLRIFKFLQHQSEKQNSRVQRSSLTRLNHLSEELTFELAHELNVQFVKEHPLLRHLEEQLPVVMVKLCGGVIKAQTYAEEEFIFSAFEQVNHMYFSRVVSSTTSMRRPQLRLHRSWRSRSGWESLFCTQVGGTRAICTRSRHQSSSTSKMRIGRISCLFTRRLCTLQSCTPIDLWSTSQ